MVARHYLLLLSSPCSYPDATVEELEAVNNVCIICREEMVSRCKKLPCNHIFHTACLQSWFQRQQTCPTCRMDILSMSLGLQRGAAQGAQQRQQGAPRQQNHQQHQHQHQHQNLFQQQPQNGERRGLDDLQAKYKAPVVRTLSNSKCCSYFYLTLECKSNISLQLFGQ